jgi:hypothetical protein
VVVESAAWAAYRTNPGEPAKPLLQLVVKALIRGAVPSLELTLSTSRHIVLVVIHIQISVTYLELARSARFQANAIKLSFGLNRLFCLTMLLVVQEALMTNPRDVIYAAIHSAFVKYPREDDPASHDHWIQPEEAGHLTKVVLAELEANGFQIVKKST